MRVGQFLQRFALVLFGSDIVAGRALSGTPRDLIIHEERALQDIVGQP